MLFYVQEPSSTRLRKGSVFPQVSRCCSGLMFLLILTGILGRMLWGLRAVEKIYEPKLTWYTTSLSESGEHRHSCFMLAGIIREASQLSKMEPDVLLLANVGQRDEQRASRSRFYLVYSVRTHCWLMKKANGS